MRLRDHIATTCFLYLLFYPALSEPAQDGYIEITAKHVNIRSAPSTNARVVAKSRKGDIFLLGAELGKWFKIKMFTQEPRFVYKSLAGRATYTLTLPEKMETRHAIYKALRNAERRALEEASEMYIVDIEQNIMYDQLLNDRYKLDLFHSLGLQSPVYQSIMDEAEERKWE